MLFNITIIVRTMAFGYIKILNRTEIEGKIRQMYQSIRQMYQEF